MENAVILLFVIAITIFSGMGRPDLSTQQHLGQQKSCNCGNGGDGGEGGEGGEGEGGGYGSSPGSTPTYGSNPVPTPTYGSTPIPTEPGSGTPYYETPSVPEIPAYGSTPTHFGGGGHGTCDYWSNNYGSWPDIFSTLSTIASIFGKPASSMYGGTMTLMQALQKTDKDGYSSLLREATASLLNSYAYKSFPFSPEDVRAKFGAALSSATAAAAQASQFARANVEFK